MGSGPILSKCMLQKIMQAGAHEDAVKIVGALFDIGGVVNGRFCPARYGFYIGSWFDLAQFGLLVPNHSGEFTY